MKRLMFVMMGAFLCTSCARQISADVYPARQAGEVAMTYAGIVKGVREVRLQGSEQLQDNTLGIATGGIAGGVIGGAVSGGKFIPTAAGAVLGAVTGSLVENRAREQAAVEYIVALDNGDLVTVIQGRDVVFGVGQPVYVTVSRSGRSHLSARGF